MEAARVVPQPRGYRPNPRFAATTPRRSYSQDSVAMAKEEIQKAVAANTLSKEEYDEIMMALGAPTDYADSDSYRDDNENNVENLDTNADGINEDSLTGQSEDNYPPVSYDGPLNGEREDNYPSLPTIRSEESHPPLPTIRCEGNDYHAEEVDAPETVPAGNTQQALVRSASSDSFSDRQYRLRNSQEGLFERPPSQPIPGTSSA